MKKASILLIATMMLSSVAITVIASDNQNKGKAEVLKIGYNSNKIVSINSNRMFIQLPAPPGDPMPLPWTSHSPYGWRCHEDFWEITSPICDIHWWGCATTYFGGIYYPSDPEGMCFNIIFYENDNGKPGNVICSYIDIKPSFYSTGIMYDYSEYPEAEGLFELFYFKTSLDPCCDLSEGWVSIQSIYSPTDSDFSWIESLFGNNNSLQYGWGDWYNISNFAYILTDASANPIPDIVCEGNLNWKNVDQGSKVIGNFSVENTGDPDSILHWKIESFPDWGSNWTFTPSASILTPEDGSVTVEVEVVAPEKPKRFRGKIKVVNAEDLSDFCEISVNLQTSLNYPSKNLVPLDLKERKINSIPFKSKLQKNMDNGFIYDNKENFVPGEFIVKLIDDINTIGPSIKLLNEKYMVGSIERIFKDTESPVFANIYKIIVPENSDILSIADDYSSLQEVVYAVPNYIAYSCIVPNDPSFNLQWALNNIGQTAGTPDADIDAVEAWDIETGDEETIITISDTGVDWDHPDLAAKIWINTDEVLDGTDTDGNGFIDDIRGWDFVNNDNNPIDDNGHGTCCAGVASAITDNNVGMAGICWNCKIMPIKGLNQGGSGTYQDLADGIIYAADNSADVISMSWAGSGSSPIMENAIDYAHSKGVVLVAAAANSHTDFRYYPAAYENVIGVAATYYNDEKMYFSNFGSWVDVAAPGYDIFTTALDDDYNICFWGTSAATPHVAGVTGLMVSKNPSFTPNEVQTIIRSTTDPVKSNQYIGIGRINAYEAIKMDSTTIANLNSSLDEVTIISEISINGTACGANFEDYIVCYGVGIYPDDWTVIHESSDPIIDGVLATWAPPLDLEETTFSIRLMVHDTFDQITEDRAIVYVNLPPDTPKIEGPDKGGPDRYTYSIVTTDPNDDDILYYIDWGDGSFVDWDGPYGSGEMITIDHYWDKKGSFTIRVKASDIYSAESDWGTFQIIIPRKIAIHNSLLKWIIDRFQLIERFLLLIY